MERFADLYGILYKCPKKDRDQCCPISKIEPASFEDKIEWLGELNDEEKYNIRKYHFKCSKLE